MSVFYKSKTLSQLPTVEVEPAQMKRGGDVDPDRIAAYMSNNPIIADARRMEEGGETSLSSNARTRKLQQYFLDRGLDLPPRAESSFEENEDYREYLIDMKKDVRSNFGDPTDPGLGYKPEEAAYLAENQPIYQDYNEELKAQKQREFDTNPEVVQQRLDQNLYTKEDILNLVQQGFTFSEPQFAQLFEAGVLTREEIAALVDAAIAETDAGDDITTEDVERIAEAAGITEDQVLDLISQQLEGFDPNIDTSGFATQDQLSQFATQDQLDNFATQEQIQGLESLFQNYLTPEQLQGYLPQEGQYVTPEQLAEATTGQYDEVIQGLTDKLGTLEQQYQDVQSQYEADAVESQIDQTKEDLDALFRSSVPTGPRTGSTSQFSSGASFLPGGSPMANLIGGQRQGLGQDAFSTYLKTFTPSYGIYEEPVDPETYGQAGLPQLGIQYSNPFTGGASYSPPGNFSQGGQVTNGIMDLTNFDTNVQPFQNAFRPNVPRN